MIPSMHYNIRTNARILISSAVETFSGSKSKKCTSKHYYLLFVHVLVLILMFRGSQRFRRRNGAIYPILTSSREHFLRAVRPYTVLREVDRELAGDQYLEAPQLRKSDTDALRVLVEHYIHFHRTNRNNASRILIFRPQRTGLGDRLAALAFSFWAASVSERLFLADWQYPFPLSQLFQNANADVDMFFNRQVDDPNNETINGNPSPNVAYVKANQKEWKHHESILLSKVKIVIVEANPVPNLPKSLIEKKFPPGVVPSFVNGVPRTISFFRIVFHHVFKLSDEMREYQTQVSKRMRIRPTYPIHFQKLSVNSTSMEHRKSVAEQFHQGSRPYIAVHARVGTGVGEGQEKGRFADISRDMKTGAMCLASRAVRLAHMSGDPPLPIYLATDTPSFRAVFRDVVERFSHGRVEVVVGDWDVVHINAFTLPGNTRGAQTPKQQKALRDTYVDLVMLGHAEHMVALCSSFPRVAQSVGTARTLTELRNEICFKVDKWK